MPFTLRLALCAVLVALGCATNSTQTSANDWRRLIGESHPGSTMLLLAESFADPGFRVTDNLLCQQTPPVPQRNMDIIRVRFTAPLSGGYAVNPMAVDDEDYRHARPLAPRYVLAYEAAEEIDCYLLVPERLNIDALHISRLQLRCPNEPTRRQPCRYEPIPVAVNLQVERNGQRLQTGQTYTYPHAYLYTLHAPTP